MLTGCSLPASTCLSRDLAVLRCSTVAVTFTGGTSSYGNTKLSTNSKVSWPIVQRDKLRLMKGVWWRLTARASWSSNSVLGGCFLTVAVQGTLLSA